MNMSKKGLKMNISKCLKNYDFEKSEEFTTDVRGQHRHTNGYRFEGFNHENEYVLMYWEDENLNESEKSEKMKEIFDILDKHGFNDYIKYQEKDGNIVLYNFRG